MRISLKLPYKSEVSEQKIQISILLNVSVNLFDDALCKMA